MTNAAKKFHHKCYWQHYLWRFRNSTKDMQFWNPHGWLSNDKSWNYLQCSDCVVLGTWRQVGGVLIARVGGVRRWTSNQPRVLIINLVEILVGPRRRFIAGQLGAFNRGPRRMLSSGSEDLVETSTRKQVDDIIAGGVNVYQIRFKDVFCCHS